MDKEIDINKMNKSITFQNRGIGFTQLGIAKEILDLIDDLQQENKQLKETIKEATRILNSAKNHYGNDGKNWALERVIELLGDKE